MVLGVGYTIAQGFGWEWSQDKKPAQAARYNLVMIIFLLLALVIGFIGPDPLQLALLASTIIALFLPLSLLPFLVIMNNRDYLGTNTNKAWTNLALLVILMLSFGVAVVSLPLEILSGGG